MLFPSEAQLTPDLSWDMTIDAAFTMSVDAGAMEVVARVSPQFLVVPLSRRKYAIRVTMAHPCTHRLCSAKANGRR